MNISNTAKQLIKNMIIICTFIIVAFYLFNYDNIKNVIIFINGLVLGLTFTVLKVILIEFNINKAVSLSSKNADNYMRLGYMFRYILTGAILIISATNPTIFNLFGTITGIISLQIAVYMTRLKKS